METGSPSFDITSTNQAFYSIGLQQDLWIPINYDYFDPEDLKAMPEHVIKSHGVGTLYYAVGIAINKEEFNGDQPSSWADFWNVAKFPGKRSLPWCDAATYPLPEAALLADGVAIEDLYPVDIERAAKKLRDLSDHIIWWKKGNKPGQLLSTGEVSMAMAPNGRIQKLIDGGSPLHIVWNQSRYTFDVWYVLKGAANADNAMRFIAAASRPEAQARMARALAYGPTNPRALELLDEATLKKLPNHPDNAKKMFLKNEGWWIENRSKWIEACTEALL